VVVEEKNETAVGYDPDWRTVERVEVRRAALEIVVQVSVAVRVHRSRGLR
jgi:hypothetical protein